MPPSTRKVDAVMKDESSEAKKAAAAAISVASPKRPMGMWTRRRAARSGSLAKSSCSSGVFTGPGHSALTRTPWRGKKTPSPPDKARTPPLEAGDLARGGAHDRHEGGGVDDRPLAPGQQVRQRVLAAQVDRREVDPLHAVPG